MYNIKMGEKYTDKELVISPEGLEVANIYLSCLSVSETASQLRLHKQEVTNLLNEKAVKRYVDTIFLEQGYMNRFKIQEKLESIIDKKLEELEEAELSTNKDIVDLLTLAHKMRIDELKVRNEESKINKPVNQQNLQVNTYGDNYTALIEKLMKNGD